ncbi:unnamed protein product [Urochloa humidicola]
MAFEAGAMPNLQQLWLTFEQKERDKATVPVGMEHLGRLSTIYVACARVNAFTDMFREAVKGLPSQLKFYRFSDTETFRYQE